MFLSARRAKGQGQPLALPLFVPQPRLIDSSVPSLKHLRPKLFFEPFARPVTREPRSDPSSHTLFHASRSISRYHDNNETANIKIWWARAELQGNENHDADIYIYIYVLYKIDGGMFCTRYGGTKWIRSTTWPQNLLNRPRKLPSARYRVARRCQRHSRSVQFSHRNRF